MINSDRIGRNEIGLWFRQDAFQGVLGPGRHRDFVPFFSRDRVEVIDRLAGKFEHPQLDVLIRDPALARALRVIDLHVGQRARILRDGRTDWILGPGRHAFWNQPVRFEVEVFDAD